MLIAKRLSKRTGLPIEILTLIGKKFTIGSGLAKSHKYTIKKFTKINSPEEYPFTTKYKVAITICWNQGDNSLIYSIEEVLKNIKEGWNIINEYKF